MNLKKATIAAGITGNRQLTGTKRQKVYLKEGSSKPAPSFPQHVCFGDTRGETK